MIPIHRILLLLLIFDCGFLAHGQESQSVIPVAPDILLQFPNVRDFTISSDGNEAYFSAQSPMGEFSVLMKIKKDNNKWNAPEIVPFSGKFMDLEPFLTWDSKRLYFASNRPLNQGESEIKDYDIWYVERKNPSSSWSGPINCGTPVNSEHNEFYPSLTRSGNLYITSDPPTSKGKDDIYVCKWNGNSFEAPASLGDSINTEGYEFNAFIAHDETFLVYTGYNRKDGLGSGDLYINFRNADGSWSGAINLGKKINSNKMDYCPYIDIKNGEMYFTSRRVALSPPEEGFKNAIDFTNFINSYQNGLSRIYKVKFDPGSYR